MLSQVIELLLFFIGFIIIFCITKWFIEKTRDPYEILANQRRNSKAKMLCRKLNEGKKLSIWESASMETWMYDGIVIKNNNGSYLLSEKALREAGEIKNSK